MQVSNYPKYIDKGIKAGFGSGSYDEYKPWINVIGGPKGGRVSRIKGLKIKREHQLLSDLERNILHILDFSDRVLDIREQYPLLPIQETLLIADELGIKHPTNPKNGELVVMTTDFNITLRTEDGSIDIFRTVKYEKDLYDSRVLEKFEIEREWCRRNNINWGIITEKYIDSNYILNLQALRNRFNLSEVEGLSGLNENEITYLKKIFLDKLHAAEGSGIPLIEITNDFDRRMSICPGVGIALYHNLIATKWIEVNLYEKINSAVPAKFHDNNLFIDVEDISNAISL